MTPSPRFLVHVHVYYKHIWPEIKKALRVMEGRNWDLWVTMVQEHEDIRKDVMQMKEDAHVQLVENRGYDVAPFLHVLDQVNTSDYDFCVKLHTKQTILAEGQLFNYRSLGTPYKRNGAAWRESLLTFTRPRHFKTCLRAFDRNKTLGMVGDHRFVLRKGLGGECVATDGAKELLQKVGLPNDSVEWISGTMFICRAKLLEPLKKLGLKAQDFPIPDKKHTISLPHMVETMIGGAVVAQGYRIDDVYTPRLLRMARFIGALTMVISLERLRLVRIKHTKNNHLLVKICKIPVYIKKLS